MRSTAFRFLASTIGVLVLTLGTRAQVPDLSIPWIFGGGPAAIEATPSVAWLDDGRLIVEGEGEVAYAAMDPATGSTSPLVDKEPLLASLRTVLGAQIDSLPFPETLQGGRAAFAAGDDVLVLDLAAKSFRRIGKPGVRETAARLSPDGTKLAFVRASDLYVLDLATGTETRLTDDGSPTIRNGTLSWVYWEEIFGRQDLGYWWSPDSRTIAFLRTDDSMVSECTHLDFRPAVPRVLKQRYPKAGGVNPSVRLGLVDAADAKKKVWVKAGTNSYEYLVRVQWLPGNDRVSFQTLDRAHQTLELWLAKRDDGVGTKILTETDPGWVNIHDDLVFLKDGRHFLWVSERDGWSHIYRYALDGTLVNQVTKGPWAVHSATSVFWLRQAIQAVDEKAGVVYFGALKDGVTETHLYKVGLDGGEPTRLTSEAGTHAVKASPDAAWFLDEHSSVAVPPSLRLLTNAGAVQKVFSEAKGAAAVAMGLVLPELTTIPTKDGFPMPARIHRPASVEPGTKLPVIVYVYGGPSSRGVTNAWDRYLYWNNLLGRKGFAVLEVDNRSATGISKTVENSVLGQMTGDGELADLVDAVRWLKTQPWVDPTRVGLWGWSNGGMMTLLGMTRSTEFKAGISVAPVTDWTFYDSIWAETVNKRPIDNPAGYANTNLVNRAKDLSGQLLLVHGTYDDNVHIQNTWAFVDACIAANKLLELQIYPMRQHGIADRSARIHLFTTMLDFWTRRL